MRAVDVTGQPDPYAQQAFALARASRSSRISVICSIAVDHALGRGLRQLHPVRRLHLGVQVGDHPDDLRVHQLDADGVVPSRIDLQRDLRPTRHSGLAVVLDQVAVADHRLDQLGDRRGRQAGQPGRVPADSGPRVSTVSNSALMLCPRDPRARRPDAGESIGGSSVVDICRHPRSRCVDLVGGAYD